MIVRSYGLTGQDQFHLNDWTQEVNVVPNQWGFLQGLGIFEPEPVTQHAIVFEETQVTGAVILDRVRGGERGMVGKDALRKNHSFVIPHFPHDDYISPSDLQGVSAYGVGTGTQPENLAAVRARKLARIRQNHAWTLETARAQLITAGTAYAPNGTVVQDWNAEFGVTRLTVDFLFGTASSDIVAACELAIAQIQDNAFGANVDGVLALCSPGFFRKLIAHPNVKVTYTYFMQTGQNPLKDRLAAGFSMGARRTFEFAGVSFVEMRDAYNGVPLIPAGNAYMIPMGTTEVFKTYFSPAQRFDLVNTPGEQVYVFETADQKGTKIELESESNFMNAIMRPALIVNLISSN